MKKFLVYLLIAISLVSFVSCGKEEAPETSTTTTTPVKAEIPAPKAEPAETETPAPAMTEAPAVEAEPVKAEKPVAAEGTYKLGMGVVVSDGSTDERAQYDAVVAAVVTDADGRIVDVRIDDAQNKMDAAEVDPEKAFLSKYELQFDYNMVKYSEAQYEWFEQADAFASYCIGKTADEVAATATRVRGNDEPHPGYTVFADEDLFATCSIDIVDFIEAVVKGANDRHAQEFTADGEFTLGLKLSSNATGTTEATEDTDGVIKMYADFGAAVVDENGVILASLTDAIQPNISYDIDGEVIDFSYRGTKKELEFDYNMVKYSEATLEWFEQARAFEDYTEGLTASQLLATETRVRGNDEPHPGYVVFADEDLFASCSMTITDFIDVIAEAAIRANRLSGAKVVEDSQVYTLGMGTVVADRSSDDVAQYDATVAAVVTDENGVIVDVVIDDAQNKMAGADIDPDMEFLTKNEKKFDYNMVKYSEAQYEWFEQAHAFAQYCIGKTADEVAATATRVRTEDEPHPGYVVFADEDLFATCSIEIVDFIDAVVKAANDKHAQQFTADGDFKLGLKLSSNATGTTEATEDSDGVIKMYADFGAAVINENGEILASLTDAIQPNFSYDEDGEVFDFSYRGTKKELEFDYNMVKYSEATREWFEQARAFEDYTEGLTADELRATETRVRGNDEPHPGYVVFADEDLFASCSMTITDFIDVIADAADNAKICTID